MAVYQPLCERQRNSETITRPPRSASTKQRRIQKSTTLVNHQSNNTTVYDIIIMVKDQNGKGMILRALLDSGCSRTIILKQFTNRKNRRLLAEKDKNKIHHLRWVFHVQLCCSNHLIQTHRI